MSDRVQTIRAPGDVRTVLDQALRSARERPSFALYLAGLLLFPVKWLSPFAHQQAGWIDVLIGISAVVWAWEQLRDGARPRLRAPHYFGAAYLALGLASAALGPLGLSAGKTGVLIMVELAIFAVLTSDFARAPERRSAIVLVILVVVFVTGVEVAVAVGLFYAGVNNSMLDGWLGAPSHVYERISAGFYSSPLLGSFCIFASALLALDGTGIPARWRRAGQVVLAIVVLFTFSRAIIGFALAMILRAAHRRGTGPARLAAALAAVLSVLAIAGLSVARFYPNLSHPSETTVTAPFQSAGNDRLQPITTSFHTLVHHPLLGLGPNSYPGNFEGQPRRAHFTPLNVAATLGLPALVALIGLIWSLWRARRRPTNIAIWSGLAGLGLDALGQDVEHFRHIWMMIGFADADRAEDAGRDDARTDASAPSAARPRSPAPPPERLRASTGEATPDRPRRTP